MTDLTQRSALRVSPLVVPAGLDAADAGPFLEMVRLANAVCLADAGHDDLREEAQEVLGLWQDQTDWTQLGFIAARDGGIVGAVKIMISTQEDTTSLEFDLMVDPERRGQGAEEALLAAVEAEARARGIRTTQTWTLHRPDRPGPRLSPPSGFGTVPADDSQTVAMRENGFTLQQVERNSVFDLRGPAEPLERMLAEARAAAGEDYRLLTWTSPTPPEHLDGFAYAISRMSTDAPTGGLVIEEQHWDAARVQRRDARLKAQGLTVSVAAAQHVPTGTIAAYNELVIAEDRTGATQQYGTLVVKGHRGRRLGTVVKCANLLRWRELVPESPRVSTFNAEENRHMLDINEAIGFVPASYAGAWQKVLS
ncbi:MULTISPECIES: GNAT family N-acetyltransferase [unclassified Microbacterium]|uniref:GNAT family N-acetyltransferase n=1 Tax=unclassified Microbacterium TaxID=2609290 RepID=UPI00214B7EE1|nr:MULTISPECIES: GNAT family N-acetyltransferase [unclassified Microbacterium]MCR2809376.1 GNAT family N-acetyltransferase [Microbacterium sp. zg.B185]WIM20514.1 GNAT family N-acetyltransferase [Microbacterium sp. zg-B185]